MHKNLLSNPILLTVLSLLAFAGNSILCRLALKDTQIDAASFNTIRLISGAMMLWLIVTWQARGKFAISPSKHSFFSALSLFVYAATFAFAYVNLSAATGALLLFGSVQFTMIAYAIWHGERLTPLQIIGLSLAVSGVIFLLLPNSTTPPIFDAMLMATAGIAWGAYSILGKYAPHPTKTAAQSFILSLPFTLVLSLLFIESINLDNQGVVYAVISGAITSGLGYALWYRVLPRLKSTVAASAQLSVPAITAIGGAFFVGEAITYQLMFITIVILGGIALVTFAKPKQ